MQFRAAWLNLKTEEKYTDSKLSYISWHLFFFWKSETRLYLRLFFCLLNTKMSTHAHEKPILLLLRPWIKLVWLYPSNYTMPTCPAHIYQCCGCAHMPSNLVLLSWRLAPWLHTHRYHTAVSPPSLTFMVENSANIILGTTMCQHNLPFNDSLGCKLLFILYIY